jgi:hypothetical protein
MTAVLVSPSRFDDARVGDLNSLSAGEKEGLSIALESPNSQSLLILTITVVNSGERPVGFFQSAIFFVAESVVTYADGTKVLAVGIVGDGMGAFIIKPNGVATRADTHFAFDYATADVRSVAADVSNQKGVAIEFDP